MSALILQALFFFGGGGASVGPLEKKLAAPGEFHR